MIIFFVGQIILVSEHFVGNLFFPFLSIFTNIVNIRIDMPQGRKKKGNQGYICHYGYCNRILLLPLEHFPTVSGNRNL